MATAGTRSFSMSFRRFICPLSRHNANPSSFVVHQARPPLRPVTGARTAVTSYQAHFRRWQSTMSGTGDSTFGEDDAEPKEETWLEKAKKRSWLWRWLNDVDEIEKSIMSEEEYMEREKMVEKLMDRYFDTPDAKFDLDIFEEIFELLIKYNDREGVKMFWGLMSEMQVEPTDELREQVETYLVKAREASWYE